MRTGRKGTAAPDRAASAAALKLVAGARLATFITLHTIPLVSSQSLYQQSLCYSLLAKLLPLDGSLAFGPRVEDALLCLRTL